MNVFLAKLGVPSNVQVVDVFSLEPDMLGFVPQPVAALMLLFPDDNEVISILLVIFLLIE